MKKIVKWLQDHFLAGLLVLAPPVLTIWLVSWLFEVTTAWIGPDVRFIDRFVVLLCMFMAIVLLGLLAHNYLGAKFLYSVNALVDRLPGINMVYKSIRQISAAFGSKSKLFSEVVFVEYPCAGTYAIRFLTADAPAELLTHDGIARVCVFVPTTPNPTSGFLLCVPKAKVIRSIMHVAEGIQMVISSGAVDQEQAAQEKQEANQEEKNDGTDFQA